MIELEFELNKEVMKVGLNENFMKRYFWRYMFSLALGLFFITLGFIYALEGRPYEVLPYVLIACGIIIVLKKQLYIRKTLKNMFKGKPQTSIVKYKFDETTVFSEVRESKGEVKWAEFYHLAVGPRGIHLFVQKGLFYWIPREATMLQGTWDELTELVDKVKR